MKPKAMSTAKIVKIKTAAEYEKEIAELKLQLQFKTELGISLSEAQDREQWLFLSFTKLMKAVMTRHDHKNSKQITQTHIMEKLHEEVAELVIMLKEHNTNGPCTAEECERDKEEMLHQCADISNIAFLIYVLIKHVG